MRKSFLLLLLTLFIFTTLADASPQISFTSSSRNGKVILTPTVNNDVTHYKWETVMKGGGYESETEWINSVNLVDHISYLDSGHYFITLKGKNISSNEETSFTNTVVVSVDEDAVSTDEEAIKESGFSLIISNLPEPLRSYLQDRNDVELSLIVASCLFVLFLVSRRKKKKKFVLLEKIKQ